MTRMKNFIYWFVLFGLIHQANAQYWFGPKVGFHRVDHNYQTTGYKGDSFNIAPNYNFQVGFVMTYTASKRYSAHAEINWERIGKHVKNIENENLVLNQLVDSRMNFHFLTIPFMLRVNFGRPPVHYYINGGPKLSFWLGGNGNTTLEEFVENRLDENGEVVPEVWQIRFKQRKSDKQDINSYDPYSSNRMALEKANILQYSLTLGGGAYFDIRGGSRIMLDLRYSFGHSNMGFNGSQDFEWEGYYENFEYRHHMMSLSAGYMFEFDAKMQRKGKSTNKLSNKK